MNSRGMVRLLDELGRIVLPVELRRTQGIQIGDSLEFFDDERNGRLLLRKYRAMECIFCFSPDQITIIRDRLICHKCLDEVTNPNVKVKS
ncbi:AbrB/MazE/SpoVT family DNA-binding domain-containing protein [Paenibacillus sp. GCM10027626]|uniref:AbrB/MazE/SpoVT family DNA-binding domain-containing protein n=1 Tax=Paenibacillus sp. GCM10027626 TaxID=3273411 RepID=UPI0036294F38